MSGFRSYQMGMLASRTCSLHRDRFRAVEDDVISCKLMTGFLFVQLVCAYVTWADARWIEGTYRNPALGYSVKIPPGLRGKAGDEAGPERGVGIPLPSGGTVTVYGEPNSLEWKSPEDGVRFALTRQDSACRQHEVMQTRVGKLSGAKETLCAGTKL